MKKPNIKALMIDHGEKIALSFFVLIVLGVLAKTSWGRYSKSPDQLRQNVENARNKISAPTNVWPKAEEEAYKVVDFSDKARQLFAPLPLARYEFTPPLFHPLYRKNDPKREPSYEPVVALMINTGLAAVSMSSGDTGETADEAQSMASTETSTVDTTGEFADRSAASPLGTGVPLGVGAPGMAPGAGAHGPRSSGAPGTIGAPKSGAKGAHGGGAGGGAHGNSKSKLGPTLGNDIGSLLSAPGTMSSSGSMAGMASAGVKARGVRYVAIRGVFPLRKQIENYKKALHLLEAEASSKVEIAGFVLERQMAMDGEDPWKNSEWKTVDVNTAVEFLSECSDLDTAADPLPTSMRDPAITMDLPLRLIGFWGNSASHPLIKDEELHGEAITLRNKMEEAVDTAFSESNLPENGKPKARGLRTVQRDIKGMANEVRGNTQGMDLYKQMMRNMGGPGGPGAAMAPGARGPAGGHGASAAPMSSAPMNRPMGPGGGHGAPSMGSMGSMASMMQRGGMGMGGMEAIVVASKYLLFRYFDFDVESGRAYRYRVRLQLANPNYQLPPDELAGADPEIASGAERETPWSNVSNAEVVPTTVNYFLTKVDREPYRDEKVKAIVGKPVAQVEMFDWSTDYGTVISDSLDLPVLGNFIGEKKKETLLLDLVEGTLSKKKDFQYTTRDALLDVQSDTEIPADQHPDLKLPVDKKRGVSRLGLLQEALVVTALGELKVLDPVSEKAQEDYWIGRRKKERENFEEGADPKGSNRLGMLAGQGEEESDGKGKKKRNPRRGGPASSMDMMRMMMPGGAGGGPPGGGGAHGGSKKSTKKSADR